MELRIKKGIPVVLAAVMLVGSAVTNVVMPNIELSTATDRPATSAQTSDGTSASPQTFSIPDYSGSPSISLSDNSNLDISNLPSEAVLPDLDCFGRCGAVEMVVTPDTMPAASERRGSIGMVKPSGWHTIRDDSLDGRYLYNRCHLIAWCLSSMNAEERNLITGTRYMNMEGMLPYETQVAKYVERTGNSVLYRVTPDFRDNELVARGVRIQARSIGNKYDRLSLDVYCYNVQPGYTIDYLNGTASKN